MIMRHYETVAIVDPMSGTEGVDKVLGRFKEAFETTGAKEVRVEDWGTRRMAYSFNKVSKGHYLYVNYLGTNTTVAEVERLLGITEQAVKYQTIVLDKRVQADAFDFEAGKNERSMGWTNVRRSTDEGGY